MDGHDCIETNISCKIKYSPWEDYNIIKCPSTFKILIRILSSIFYPNNFSLNYYIKDQIAIIPISNEKDYLELMSRIRICGYKEIIFFVNVDKMNKKSLSIIQEDNEENNPHIDIVRYRTDKFCKYVKCL
jgi:hypothetical protein